MDSQEKEPLFFVAPVSFFDSVSKVIVPSFAALFSASFIEIGGNECPFLRSFGVDEFFEKDVFFGSPGSFGFLLVFSDGLGFDIGLKEDGFLKGG